jgi:hypothetical protein
MLGKIFDVNGVPIGKPKEALHLFWGLDHFLCWIKWASLCSNNMVSCALLQEGLAMCDIF